MKGFEVLHGNKSLKGTKLHCDIFTNIRMLLFVALGGLVVSVLATVSRVRSRTRSMDF
jgi:hypothetical protein